MVLSTRAPPRLPSRAQAGVVGSLTSQPFFVPIGYVASWLTILQRDSTRLGQNGCLARLGGGVLYAAGDERIRADSVHYDRASERAAQAVVAVVLRLAEVSTGSGCKLGGTRTGGPG